jgi:hypothetical protein
VKIHRARRGAVMATPGGISITFDGFVDAFGREKESGAVFFDFGVMRGSLKPGVSADFPVTLRVSERMVPDVAQALAIGQRVFVELHVRLEEAP